MASERMDVDELNERPKWGDNIKVYTRKNRKKASSNNNNSEIVTITDTRHPPVENGISDAVDVAITTSCPTIGSNENEKSGTVPQESSQILATEEAISAQPQQAQPDKQAEVTAPSGPVIANGNGALGLVTKVEDRVRVNLKSGRPKKEIHELKRKFSNELDQVRSVVRRLEDEEVMLSGRSTASGAVGYGGLSHQSMNDNRALMRVHSDVGSVAQYNPRPFQPLSVSIMENNHGFGDLAEKEKRTPKANPLYQSSDFLLGKDRLTPEMSKRKWKPHGGKKYGRQGSHKFNADKYISKSFKGSSDLLARLMKHKNSWLFNKPVDVVEFKLHDYHDIIKNPMDLGTIKVKLSKHLYKSPMEFAEDVKLTFNNAMTYNPKGHDVHTMAEELLKIFEAKWPSIESDYNLALKYEMIQDMGLPTPTPTPTPRPYDMGLPTPTSRPRDLPTPTSRPSGFRNLDIPESNVFDPKAKLNGGGVGRTPVLKKPKAKDVNKRDMTYDEKQKLSANLQSLPSEKLVDIVQIIKKRNTALSQHDDEIEVDIDSVDAETLWELDRFVANFKKNASKKKRRAEIVLKAGFGTNPPVSTAVSSHAPDVAKSLEHSKIGEKSLANPLSNQREGEGAGAGRSSSSTSSSSGSGSSSSDSDSDTSSSNGSEKGGSPKTSSPKTSSPKTSKE